MPLRASGTMVLWFYASAQSYSGPHNDQRVKSRNCQRLNILRMPPFVLIGKPDAKAHLVILRDSRPRIEVAIKETFAVRPLSIPERAPPLEVPF